MEARYAYGRMPGDSRWDEFLVKIRDLAQKQAELRGAQVEPTVLLPGEDPLSPHADDAAHWAAVYRELVEAKEAVHEKIREQKANVPAAARPELSLDERVSLLELERLRLHLGYWESKGST